MPCATPSTTGSPPRPPTRRGSSNGSSSAPRSGYAAGRRRRSAARTPRASCGFPASSPTAARATPPAPKSSSSRAIRAGGSAKQARDRATQAILPLRGKILNVANAGREKLAANQQLSDLMLALGVSPRARLSRGRPALRPRHHHDRRRRRRRPYRLAADHLLLPRDAGADPRRPPLPRRAAALSPQPGAEGRSTPATTPTARSCSSASSRATARSRSAASRASAR